MPCCRSLCPQDQVEDLLKMIQELQEQNGGTYYTNEMYRRAEEQLRQEEARKREEAEKKKQAKIDAIKEECKKDFDIIMTELNLEHEKKLVGMQEEMASLSQDKFELKQKLTEGMAKLKDEHHQHILSMEEENKKQIQGQINTIQELHNKEMAEMREQIRVLVSRGRRRCSIM